MTPEGRSSRRQFMAAAACASASSAMPALANEETIVANPPFGYCLNTATIMGQKLGIVEEVNIASRAGYQGIEPWIRELDQYVKDGHSLKDLRKRITEEARADVDVDEVRIDSERARRIADEQSKFTPKPALG